MMHGADWLDNYDRSGSECGFEVQFLLLIYSHFLDMGWILIDDFGLKFWTGFAGFSLGLEWVASVF